MRVLFLLSIGLVKQATSCHLITAIIEAVCDAGNTVHIIQKQADGEFPKELEKLPVTIETIQFHAAEKKDFIARYINEVKYMRSAGNAIKINYDAVFIQSTTAAGFAVKSVRKKLPRAIVTFNVQDIFPHNLLYSGGLKKNLVFKTLAAIQRYGYKKSNHIVTISEDMKETLVADGVKSEKVRVIYNWSYQNELYDELDLSPVAHMFKNNYFNVVYAGNIGVMQNVDVIIEAAKLMQNDKSIWFHIIGNGVYKDKLEARAKKYGITNISFWPMQPSEMAPLIYSAADVNVIPLVKNIYRTALPSKTATCFACQKPVVFAIGKDSKFGQKAMKEAGSAVVESDNPEELVEAIRRIKDKEKPDRADEFFLKYFKKTENSKKYAKIITESE